MNSSQNIPKLRFPEFQGMPAWEEKKANNLFQNISNKEHQSDLPILAITQEYGAIPRDMINYNVIVSKRSISSYKVVEVGDFIISLRSFQGGIEYSEYEGLCSPAYIILKKKTELCNLFFKYFFKTNKLIDDLNKNIEGIRDGKMVSYKQCSELLIPFPAIPEQQKIADCLSSLDDRISAENDKLTQLQEHKKGLLQKLFPADGTERVPSLRFAEFADSGKWEIKRLGDIAKVTTGGTPSTGVEEYWGGSIPWMNSGELNNKIVYKVHNYITDVGFKESSTKLIPKRCVLVGLAGQGKTRGTAAINYIELCTNQSIAAIYPNTKIFNSEYMYCFIDSIFDILPALKDGDSYQCPQSYRELLSEGSCC